MRIGPRPLNRQIAKPTMGTALKTALATLVFVKLPTAPVPPDPRELPQQCIPCIGQILIA